MGALPLLATILAVVAAAVVVVLRYRRRDLGTPADRATFDTLHKASLAGPGLRGGLSRGGAERAVRHLRALLGTSAVALTDRARVLAVDGDAHGRADQALEHVSAVLASGRAAVLGPRQLNCTEPQCAVRAAVACPRSTATPSWVPLWHIRGTARRC